MRQLQKSSPRNRGSNVASIRLQIAYLAPDVLSPNPDETRKASKLQEKRIGESILAHGFNIPITVGRDNVIVTGSARWRAAKKLGLSEVPVVRLEHLTEDQLRLFAIADNKLSEGREWDAEALRTVFAEISINSPGISLSSSGFSVAERDILIGHHRTNEFTDLDVEGPAAAGERDVSTLGDIWILGEHRIACGDATCPDVISDVLAGRPIRTVASDLPYNVKIAGHVSGLGKKVHEEFAMASGEMSKAEFTHFLSASIDAVKPHLVDGALLYLFMDWRHLSELFDAATGAQFKQLNLLVWAKTKASMGSFYRSAHEMIGVFKHGDEPHINNVQLGRDGRSRSNVLHYPGANTFGKSRTKALELHPTVKPVALMADLILDSTAPGDLVFDMFGGSGTTLIAAEKTSRVAALVEISPRYVDVTVRRYEALTGQQAVHAATGETFAQVSAARVAEEA